MDIENWNFFNYPLNRHPYSAKGDTGCASPLCVRVSKPVERNQVAHKEKPSRRKRKFNSTKSANRSSVRAGFVSKACTHFLFCRLQHVLLDDVLMYLSVCMCLLSISQQTSLQGSWGSWGSSLKYTAISPSCCEWGCNSTIRQWWCYF